MSEKKSKKKGPLIIPCPYCGKENIQTMATGGNPNLYFCRCHNCGATGPTAGTDEIALMMFNKRSEFSHAEFKRVYG